MKKKTKAKKPRTLNAVWADARCSLVRFMGNGNKTHRFIELVCDTHNERPLTAKQALRLSQWLAEAAAWKADQ